MDYKYFIAANRNAFDEYIRNHKLSPVTCRFIYDHLQLAGLRNITITSIGYGNRALETAIVQNYSHHHIKLEYI